MKVRFFWDFYGPHAERTALHFAKHLSEFLTNHSLELVVGTNQVAEGHYTTSYDPPDVPSALLKIEGAPETIADRVGRTLRPQRVELLSEESP